MMGMDVSQLKSALDGVLKVTAEATRKVETALCSGPGVGLASLKVGVLTCGHLRRLPALEGLDSTRSAGNPGAKVPEPHSIATRNI